MIFSRTKTENVRKERGGQRMQEGLRDARVDRVPKYALAATVCALYDIFSPGRPVSMSMSAVPVKNAGNRQSDNFVSIPPSHE